MGLRMNAETGLRQEQLRREKEQYQCDFDLFSESLAAKNPLNKTDTGKRGSSIWEEELRPFFTENLNKIPAEIIKNIGTKFQAIGANISDNALKKKYKTFIQKFLRENVRLLLFLALKSAMDTCIIKMSRGKEASYQEVVDKVGKEYFKHANIYDKNNFLPTTAATIIKNTPKKNTGSDFIKSDFIHIAAYFLDRITENQTVIQRVKGKYPYDLYHFELSNNISEYYDPQKNLGRLFKPTKLPMICPPIDWTNKLNGGGYLLKQSSILINVKSKNHINQTLAALKHVTKEKIFLTAVNILQKTAWKVNESILNVLDHFYRSNESIGTDLSKQLLYKQTFKLAHDFKDEIYYIPWYLDFRGRMYPSVIPISPQSHDEGRALLLFATPQIVNRDNDEQALTNLAIYGFNKYKPNTAKVSKQGMISWVENNEIEILKAANDPIKNYEFWRTASDKYTFLAFCFEWNNIKNSLPQNRLTSLPVYVDGTCNGFQHYAALLCDEKAAPLVNLIDTDVPGDFYQSIVEKLHLAATAQGDINPTTKSLILNYVDRNFIKKSIISAGYGAGEKRRTHVTAHKLSEVLLSKFGPEAPQELLDFHKKESTLKILPFHDEAQAIETLINSAIKELSPSFLKIRNWLRKANKSICDNGQCIGWENPAGLFVQNYYYNYPHHEVRIFIGNKSHKLCFADFEAVEGITISPDKLQSSIAPNFIHSMDSAHAAFIITKFAEQFSCESSHSIASVHDSFATHATHVNALQKIIRETFYEIYRKNQLEILKNQIEKRYSIIAPPLPKKGTLAIGDVLKSKYFFY